jgi:hypothetical protein
MCGSFQEVLVTFVNPLRGLSSNSVVESRRVALEGSRIFV